jgi:hypothetical protein
MISFYNIFIQPKNGITDKDVENVMNLALDWYRYSNSNWLVKSTSNIEKWQTRLKPLVAPGGKLVILKIDPSERQGWLSKDFWNWYDEARKK